MSQFTINEISRSDIDDQLWNSIVDTYADGKPYSYTWYLDALTQGKWKAMVIGNYDIILPLPFHRKYVYQSRVYQPFLSQYFGPLGSLVNNDVFIDLVKYINNHYPNSHLMLLQMDGISNLVKSVELRSSQTVDISNDIESIRTGYGKNRRREIRQNSSRMEIELHTDIDRFLLDYKSTKYPETKPILKQWKMFKRLLQACDQHGILEIISVKNQEELLTTAACLITRSRVISLIGVTSEVGRTLSANAVRLDAMIKEYCGKKQVFDFFGSSMAGVKKFNQQFGAIDEQFMMIYT